MAERTDNLRKAQLVLAFTYFKPLSFACPSDCAFGEGDPAKNRVGKDEGLESKDNLPEMTGFRQLKVVELDEGCD